MTWPSHEIDFAFADERHHFVDAIGGGAELVAPVQQRQMLGERRKVERPVERAVAAADDQDRACRERLSIFRTA